MGTRGRLRNNIGEHKRLFGRKKVDGSNKKTSAKKSKKADNTINQVEGLSLIESNVPKQDIAVKSNTPNKSAAIKKAAKKAARVFRDDGAGFYGLAPRFANAITVEAQGDINSFANAAMRESVKIINLVKISPKKFRCKFAKKHSDKIFAIFKRLCYNYSVVRSDGIADWLNRVWHRAGLFVATGVVAVVFFAFATKCVWQIDISGLNSVSQTQVRLLLKSLGAFEGAKSAALDLQSLENSLINSNAFADATVRLDGTTLKVDLLERADYSPPIKNVALSRFDAVVTKVVTRRGTATVKVGDVVKKGSTLIEGVAYSSLGEPLYTCEPDGEVYGKISLTFGTVLSRECVEYQRTGRAKKIVTYTLFGNELGKKSPPYENYSLVKTTGAYDIFIPLYVNSYNYYETEAVTVMRDIEELKNQFVQEKLLESSLDSRDNFTVTDDLRKLSENNYYYTVFISGSLKIS